VGRITPARAGLRGKAIQLSCFIFLIKAHCFVIVLLRSRFQHAILLSQ
jgi:hypothetical protein